MIFRISRRGSNLERIVQHRFPALDRDETIFLQANRAQAKPMCASHFITGLNQLWRGCHPTDFAQTSTSFRKAVCTYVRQRHPQLSGQLARHMNHSVGTADRFYDLVQARTTAVLVAQEIERVSVSCVEASHHPRKRPCLYPAVKSHPLMAALLCQNFPKTPTAGHHHPKLPELTLPSEIPPFDGSLAMPKLCLAATVDRPPSTSMPELPFLSVKTLAMKSRRPAVVFNPLE